MDRNKRFAVWIQVVLLVVLSGILRIQHIKSDPPRLVADISGSAGEFFDEGIYSHNARNKILYGRWITDEWNPLVYNALLTGLYYGVFKIFGISVISVKGLNILFGCLGILIFYGIVRRYFAQAAALAMTLLFSLNYYWLMYNRLGLLENFSALAFLTSFYFFVLSQRHGKLFFLTGLVVAIAVLSKYLYAFFFFSAILSVIHYSWQKREMRHLLLFAAGFLAVFLVWLVLIYGPFSHSFSKIGAGWGMLSLPKKWSQLLFNLLHQPWFRFMALMPLVGFGQMLFFASFFARIFRRSLRELNASEVFVFLWLIGGILTMGALNYRPMRYYLPLLPAVFLAGAYWLRESDLRSPEKKPFFLTLGLTAIFFIPFFRHLLERPSAFFVFPLSLRLLVYLAIIALVAALVFSKKIPLAKIVLFVFAAVLLLSLFLYLRHFYMHPTFHLEMAANSIRGLPADSVIMGQEAPRLALASRCKTLMAYEDWFNDENPFERFRPTHLLVLDKFGGAELGWMQRRFPEVIKNLKMIRRFRVWDSTVSLYRVSLPGREP